MGLFRSGTCFFCMLLLFGTCLANNQQVGRIYPGFAASRLDWDNHGGFFLLSNSSVFAMGFFSTLDVSLFVLVVIHLSSYKVVWTANRGSLVRNSDKFVFENNGNAYLESGNGLVWATNTTGQKVDAMELQDSGNLVLLGETAGIVWQSFNHPTDTLLPGQVFVEGMRLKSFPNHNNLSNYLAYESGDLVLYAGYETPQLYWSVSRQDQKSKNYVSGEVRSAILVSNSWNFYGKNGTLLWQFVFSDHSDPKAMWAAILDPNGGISFYDLNKGKSSPEETKIPEDPCDIPEPCDQYNVCFFENWCECPRLLKSRFDCKPPKISTCSQSSVELLYVGEKLDYFALKYVSPFSKSSTLDACKEACLSNCSCLVIFFENSSQSCFLFDQIGSLQRWKGTSGGYVSYMKISSAPANANANGENVRNPTVTVLVVTMITLVITCLAVGVGFFYYKKRKNTAEYSQEDLEEDIILDSISGMPARFSYSALCKATKNFSTKIGEGGFGSVYQGVLQDGTQLAVKKLEGIGQGAKEFKAEVSTIGSIHHVHLVKLKGFCAEGPHRLLVYEFMGRGSLDKWIFRNNENCFLLNWDTRFNIALGTAKGLAYLHEECEVKIVHCDIKPENVLLDNNFIAKVSDFGLAKLMSREESHVFTTLRGTRGYLAPEWITKYAISEKSDVYSYGMVLLEIIGGRKNYNQWEVTEKVHFPTYAFKMMEEGKVKEILDPKVDIDEKDERVVTAIKVALWCVQDDMNLRPSMTKVVQMLEGISPVPNPPASSQLGSYRSFLKISSGEASSSGQASFYTNVPLSCVQLSGPR